jgi:hypothetical protein
LASGNKKKFRRSRTFYLREWPDIQSPSRFHCSKLGDEILALTIIIALDTAGAVSNSHMIFQSSSTSNDVADYQGIFLIRLGRRPVLVDLI